MNGVSVVMPAWNAERFIAEALESVHAQTLSPLELIVVDDGSSDRTADIADGLGATVLRCEHAGIGPSRNTGIAASRGDVIAFLDADDVWLPTKLERQAHILATESEVGAVACWIDEFLDRPDGAAGTVRAPQLGVAAWLTSSTIVRRSVVEQIGPFDDNMPTGDWVRWWARARRLGTVEHVVPEVLARRRIHDQNNSATANDGSAPLLAAAREHLRARRAGS